MGRGRRTGREGRQEDKAHMSHDTRIPCLEINRVSPVECEDIAQ